MYILLKPAVAFMNRLKYVGKFLTLGIVLVAMTLQMTYEVNKAELAIVDYNHHELYGVEYIKKLVPIISSISIYRQLVVASLTGDSVAKEKLATLQNTINGQVNDLDVTDKALNVFLTSTDTWTPIKEKWNKIKTNITDPSLLNQFESQRELINDLIDLMMKVATSSGLTVDPDLDSYNLMDIATTQLPSSINQIAIIRDIAAYNKLYVIPELRSRFLISNAILSEVYLPNTVSELKNVTDYNSGLSPHYSSVADFVKRVDDFTKTANIMVDAGNQTQVTPEAFFTSGTHNLDDAYALYSVILGDLQNLIHMRIDKANYTFYYNLGLCSLGILLVVYLLFGIYVSVVQAITLITEGTDNMAKGELGKNISLETRDEMNRIANSFNIMRNTISSFINETQDVMAAAVLGDLTQSIEVETKKGYSKKLAEIQNKLILVCRNLIKEVKISINTVNSAAKEIASGNVDLSARTDSQAASVQETSASLEELTSTVKQNAENAKEANKLSAKASDIATKGGGVVKEVVMMMGDINTRSRRIVDIISVIDGIAFQTNILALNAAVEAARAGEQGRGFAVVATEVRSLAQRSATAAKEIKELIEDSVGKIESGSKLVDEAGTTMEEIVVAIKQVASIMGEITAASLQQSLGIEQVNQAVSQIDSITHQNSSLVNKAAKTAQVLEAQTQHMTDIIATFKVEDMNDVKPQDISDNKDVVKPHSIENLALIYDSEEKAKRSRPDPKINPQEGETWEEF